MGIRTKIKAERAHMKMRNLLRSVQFDEWSWLYGGEINENSL